MMKKLLFIFLIAASACTKGPITQVSQSRHAGGFMAQFSNRVVMDSQLITDGENFYFGTRKGVVMAVRSKNHRLLWRKKLSNSIDTSVLIDEKHAYVGTGDGKLYALDRANGKVVWNIQLSSPPRGNMTKINNLVIVGTNDGTLSACDQENGNAVWKYHHEPYEKMKIQFMIQGSVEQNRLFIGFPNGQFVALDAQTGNEIWKRWVMDQQNRFYDLASVVLVPGKGVIATLVSGPSIFFTFDGRDIWTYQNASTQASPLVLQDRILLAAHDKIVWLDLNGVEKSSINYSKQIRPAGVAYDGNKIYVSAFDGTLNVFDEKTNRWLWEYQMGISVRGHRYR
ncbi:MAG: PQQ-binding-like beta-propeller repeat protein [Bdellovibrionota bacterium]